jgi:hypothetical protein
MMNARFMAQAQSIFTQFGYRFEAVSDVCAGRRRGSMQEFEE